jgi:hypothetical protein
MPSLPRSSGLPTVYASVSRCFAPTTLGDPESAVFFAAGDLDSERRIAALQAGPANCAAEAGADNRASEPMAQRRRAGLGTVLGAVVVSTVLVLCGLAKQSTGDTATASFGHERHSGNEPAFVTGQLRAADFRVRTNAALVAGTMTEQQDQMVAPLCEALSDESGVVRYAAIAALRRLSADSALPALRRHARVEHDSAVVAQLVDTIALLEGMRQKYEMAQGE